MLPHGLRFSKEETEPFPFGRQVAGARAAKAAQGAPALGDWGAQRPQPGSAIGAAGTAWGVLSFPPFGGAFNGAGWGAPFGGDLGALPPGRVFYPAQFF